MGQPGLHLQRGSQSQPRSIYDVAAVFSHLQDAESGEFAITQISQVNWLSVIIVTVVAAIVAAVLLAIRASMKTKAKAA